MSLLTSALPAKAGPNKRLITLRPSTNWRLKFLNVIDEHSRLGLPIRVARRCKTKDKVAVLGELTSL